MSWKVQRDPFMREVAEQWGDDAVWEAGFFADDDDVDARLDDVGWLCTPIAHVAAGFRRMDQAADSNRVPVVVVATGGFWPPHAGHLAMLEQARDAIEDDGAAVVGGYLSPGHDQYLQIKWGDVAPPAAARIGMLDRLLVDAGADWVAVDPWEALHRRTSVNFTDVVTRLQAYLRHHVDPRIEVAFACGGDNARFSLAFAATGRCVVVGRPGWEEVVSTWQADPRTATSTRIRWVAGSTFGASSSMDPMGWQPSPPPSLRLRLEDERAVRSVGLDVDRWRSFQRDLQARLGRGQSVTPVRVEDQAVDADAAGAPIISLDPLTRGTVDLGVSRAFDIGGRGALGHVERPGHPPVTDQAAAIAAGSYRVLDDDSATGSTIAFALASLPADVEVVDVVTLMDRTDGEIADSRDFLVGTDDGGLVVRLPNGSLGRAPYLLPYVDPHARCGFESGDVVSFSADVWRLNAAAYDGTGLRVADLPGAAGRVLEVAGHGSDALVEDVCRAHADTLDSLLRVPAPRT